MPNTSSGFAVLYVATEHTLELPENKQPQRQRYELAEPVGPNPLQWVSLIWDNWKKTYATVEYKVDGNKVRVRIDSPHVVREGEEGTATYHLISGNQPFALVMRPDDGQPQKYFPSVFNRFGRAGLLLSKHSGWLDFEIKA